MNHVLLPIATLIITLLVPRVAASQAALAIAAPANGTVVAPGQTVSVTVTSPAGRRLSTVYLIGESPLGIIGYTTGVPAKFTVQIPRAIASRKYALTATGRTASGDEFSAQIRLDVQRPDMPTAISARVPAIVFDAPGGFSTIALVADFADDTVLDVTESSRVTYTTSDPKVATVDANGIVTAVGPGTAEIVAAYGPPRNTRRTRIAVLVPPKAFVTFATPDKNRLIAIATSPDRSVSGATEP